jgi:hypothetical protein
MSSSRVDGSPARQKSCRVVARFIHQLAPIARENGTQQVIDSACLSAFTEIEDAGWRKLAPFDVANGDQVALAGSVGGAASHRRIAAANEDPLSAQQAGRVVLANAELEQLA